MEAQKTSEKIGTKQKRLYVSVFIGAVVTIGGLVYFFNGEDKPRPQSVSKPQFDVVSNEVNPEDVRLASLETVSDVLNERVLSLETSLIDIKEEKSVIEREKQQVEQEAQILREKVQVLEESFSRKVAAPASAELDEAVSGLQSKESQLTTWEPEVKKGDRNVLFEIPAGVVVKAVLVSGADCSVAVQKPTGPNMVLLRPLDNGKLPRNVKVPLKGSVIIGNAIGDITNERVYIRAERMTLVEKNGSFVETEISAYVSGEDGREGLRGVVVDRSGQIITRVAFAAFFQGVGQTLEATLNNQTIEKLSEVGPEKSILNIDMYRNGAFQGGTTALGKLSDYYIKRAEQLQPAIQIAAGRVVDVIFTKTVKVGETDLKKRLEKERQAKGKQNG